MTFRTFLLCLCILCGVHNLVKCENQTENPFSIERIFEEGINFVDVAQRVDKVKDVSPECRKQLLLLLTHPITLLQMADAWSKFPYPGAFYAATRSDWGNYDECIETEINTKKQERLLGKFCTWGFALPDITSRDPIANAWKLSHCIPDKCTSNDLNTIVGQPLFNDKICSTKETDSELDVGAIIMIVVLVIIALIMVSSTIYDIVLLYNKKKPAHILLVAFSMYTNGKKLLVVTKQSQAKDQILCFNGMKFISMGWIIAGHSIIGWYINPLENNASRVEWPNKRSSQYLSTAHISVDTFFYISGFLLAYLYFKADNAKKPLIKQIIGIPSMILHRYLRLTPAIGMCYLVIVYLYKYFNDGPIYSYGVHKGLIYPCKKYWWAFFLYIQNYYVFQQNESLCMPTTWYLSADMQLFLVSPLIVMPLSILYRRSFKICMSALFIINIIFFAIPIFTRLHWQDYDPDFKEYDFHSKLISYFIGVMCGMYIRHEKNKTVAINRTTNLLLWFLALGTMHGIMWYRGEVQINDGYVAKSLCYSFTRPLWCISLSWIVYACVNGYGGFVNWFLSCGLMQFGAKLTYCIYIVHGMIIAHYSLGVKYRFYFSDWTVFYYTCGHFIVSLFIATIWTLAFEIPMITLEKFIFGRSQPKAPKLQKDMGHDNPQKVT